MSEGWASVWSRRAASADEPLDLERLLILDGYDTGAAGAVGAAQFRAYAGTMARMLDLRAGDRVFEVGAGAGAFLFALREHVAIEVAGCDLAASLVDAARRALPDGDFTVLAADELRLEPMVDVVVANGVFHYFPDLAYARRVLRRMAAGARRAVAVLEVPDASHRAAAERLRRDSLPTGRYERTYAGLAHLYYPRRWFRDQARQLGLDAVTFRHPLPGYPQGRLRFGAILRRRSPWA